MEAKHCVRRWTSDKPCLRLVTYLKSVPVLIKWITPFLARTTATAKSNTTTSLGVLSLRIKLCLQWQPAHDPDPGRKRRIVPLWTAKASGLLLTPPPLVNQTLSISTPTTFFSSVGCALPGLKPDRPVPPSCPPPGHRSHCLLQPCPPWRVRSMAPSTGQRQSRIIRSRSLGFLLRMATGRRSNLLPKFPSLCHLGRREECHPLHRQR
jgi:hypothetical protein